MVADLPKDEQAQAVEPGSDREGVGILDRYEKGEIDLNTLVYLMPAGGVPSHLQALLAAVKSNQVPTDENNPATIERKKAAERAEHTRQVIAQWRLDRGPGYVEAYQQFKRTGEAVEAGSRVFESDWFRQLQDDRARQIAALEEEQRQGGLTPAKEEKLKNLRQDREGDKQVSENWKSLSDDYRKLKDRENTGGMSEKEIREKEAELKARLYKELDKASPALRERLLREIEANNPAFRSEYEARLQAQNVKPEIASNIDELSRARNIKNSSDPDVQELGGDLFNMERGSSTAKAHGFSNIKTSVDVSGSFATAAADTPAVEQRNSEPVATVTVKPIGNNLS